MWNLIQTLEIFYWCPGIYRRLRKIDSSHSLIHSELQLSQRNKYLKDSATLPLVLSNHYSFLCTSKKKKKRIFSKHCSPRKLIYQVGNRFWLSAHTPNYPIYYSIPWKNSHHIVLYIEDEKTKIFKSLI